MGSLRIDPDILTINIAVEQIFHGACLVSIAREYHRYSATWCLSVRLEVYTIKASVHLVAGYPLWLVTGSGSYHTRDGLWLKEVNLNPGLTVIGTGKRTKRQC